MIEQLTKEMFANVKAKAEQLGDVKEMSESQFRVMLEAAMRKLNIVTREEFDAQQAILLRTREKLEALEKQFEALSAKPDQESSK